MVSGLKITFLMFHHRKNSVRDKAIGKEWIYSEKYTFHRQNVICLKGENGRGGNTLCRQSVGHLRRWQALKCGLVSFYGLGQFLRDGRIILIMWGKRWWFPGIGPQSTFWSLMVSLGTVMALVGVSFRICSCITMSVQWGPRTAAAVAKLLQSCPTLRDPIDGSPPGSSIHGIFQARVLEWGATAFSELKDYSGLNLPPSWI